MSIQIYNEKIDKKTKELFSILPEKLKDVKNDIPRGIKTVFNYKGRKSPYVAREVILSLTKHGQYILDPFMGSGTFVFAAALNDRNAIGIELDNYTFNVVNILLLKADPIKIGAMLEEIKKECFSDVMALYETKCCGFKNYIKTFYFDPEPKEFYNPMPHREIKDGNNVTLLMPCPKCNATMKQFDSDDELKLKQIEKLDVSRFPSHKLIENSRINITASTGADYFDTNFTHRAKYALLKIQDSINKLNSSVERDIIEYALVSALTLSRIAQYGSGSEYIYQVMRFQAQEMNVWKLFEDKIKSILEYKSGYLSSIQTSATNNMNSKLAIFEGDYSKILSDDKFKNKFDMVYTDPPYTDQVAYLERSQLYRDWLCGFYDPNKFKLTNEMLADEVVVTNAPSRREKNFENYCQDLKQMFKTFYSVLKDNGIVMMALDLGKEKYFQTFTHYINYARSEGFEFAFRIDIDKKDPTLRKQAAFINTLSKEMLVGFVKLTENNRYWYFGEKNIEFEVARVLYELITRSEGFVTLTTAVREVSEKLTCIGIEADQDVLDRISSVIKSQFVVSNGFVYIDSDKLYMAIEDKTTLFSKIYNVVPEMINRLLMKFYAFTLDDLYFEISSYICNGDPNTIEQVIKDTAHEYQIKTLIDNFCDETEKGYVKKNLPEYADAIDIALLSGTEFEEVIKRLLKAEGYFDVCSVGGAGDRGIDLIAKEYIKEDRVNYGVNYIFQAKRWVNKVDAVPIQRLHSMINQKHNNYKYGICITTSDFTKAAFKEAENTGIELVNGKEILKRLNKAFPGEYCHSLLHLI